MARDPEAQIRERAYAIWEREGRPDGEAEAHWFQAKDELRTLRFPGWGPEHSSPCRGHARRRDWVVLPRRAAAWPAAGVTACAARTGP